MADDGRLPTPPLSPPQTTTVDTPDAQLARTNRAALAWARAELAQQRRALAHAVEAGAAPTFPLVSVALAAALATGGAFLVVSSLIGGTGVAGTVGGLVVALVGGAALTVPGVRAAAERDATTRPQWLALVAGLGAVSGVLALTGLGVVPLLTGGLGAVFLLAAVVSTFALGLAHRRAWWLWERRSDGRRRAEVAVAQAEAEVARLADVVASRR